MSRLMFWREHENVHRTQTHAKPHFHISPMMGLCLGGMGGSGWVLYAFHTQICTHILNRATGLCFRWFWVGGMGRWVGWDGWAYMYMRFTGRRRKGIRNFNIGSMNAEHNTHTHTKHTRGSKRISPSDLVLYLCFHSSRRKCFQR